MADTADNVQAPNGGSLYETTVNSKPSNSTILQKQLNAIQHTNQQAAPGPVAQNVKHHTEKTGDELSNLAAARKTPQTPAATGQPLTHYHSFFSELLSWKNPRASAIAYTSIVTLIVVTRYLDIVRWAFKLSWMTLGVTVAAEAAGKLVLNNGLATQFRPRRYYTVSRETLDSAIGDVHELVNFFVIEAQRIVFAENVGASAAACVAAFVSYYLVKLMPYWGLAIFATTLAFFIPLVYTSNQELIDQHLKNASEVINAQTAQVRDAASKQTAQISAIGKQYAGDYTSKVQDMIGGRGTAKPVEKPTKAPSFPSPPTEEPRHVEVPAEPVVPEQEPMIAS